MPIVDGLSSTKMIRSFEKVNTERPKSAHTAANGRVPIIAVSASLVERERRTYVGAGFDGWILKPILFPRLLQLLRGIFDESVRTDALYKPEADWEKGGWFHLRGREDSAETKPDGRHPAKLMREGGGNDRVRDGSRGRSGAEMGHGRSKSAVVSSVSGNKSGDERRKESVDGREEKMAKEKADGEGERPCAYTGESMERSGTPPLLSQAPTLRQSPEQQN